MNEPTPSIYNGNTEFISLSILHQRLQDELISLASLTEAIQLALGITISEAAQLPMSVQRNLQAVDRLQQTLDELQRIMGYLSSRGGHVQIPIQSLNATIRLRHLANKIFDNIDTPTAPSENECGDIAWF